jgi:hypothetical protein
MAQTLMTVFVSAPITSGKPAADRPATMRNSGIRRGRWSPLMTTSRLPRCNGDSPNKLNRPGRHVNVAVGQHHKPRHWNRLRCADHGKYDAGKAVTGGCPRHSATAAQGLHRDDSRKQVERPDFVIVDHAAASGAFGLVNAAAR